MSHEINEELYIHFKKNSSKTYAWAISECVYWTVRVVYKKQNYCFVEMSRIGIDIIWCFIAKVLPLTRCLLEVFYIM